MERSEAYEEFLTQMKATGRMKAEGYDPRLLHLINPCERDEVESIIYTTFMKNIDYNLIIFLAQLKNYDGVASLKEMLPKCNIPSNCSIDIALTLFEETSDKKYLDIVMENYNGATQGANNFVIIGKLARCKPNKDIYDLLVSFYINSENSIERSSAADGLLYNKGYINDPKDRQEFRKKLNISRLFLSEDKEYRKEMIKKLESGKLED